MFNVEVAVSLLPFVVSGREGKERFNTRNVGRHARQ